MRTYGWDACKLADAYTLEELAALRTSVEAEPKNRTPVDAAGHPIGTIHLFIPKARRQLDALAWAVTHKLKAMRASV